MTNISLSAKFELHFAPFPGVMRALSVFERSLKGGVKRLSEPMQYPVIWEDASGTLRIEVGPDSFALVSPKLESMERFNPSAASMTAQFLRQVPSVTPREVELSLQLGVAVPDLAGSLGGYSIAAFAWPRKLDLRPEALGKDHFTATETGVVHLRLSTLVAQKRPELRLLMANRHDRLNQDPDTMDQAYALCLRGIKSIVSGLSTPAWRRALAAVVPLPASQQAQARLKQAYGGNPGGGHGKPAR